MLSAWRYADEAQLEPRLLVRAMELTALCAGVRRVRARVVRIEHDGRDVSGVALDDGTRLAAPRVVLAAGSWSSLLPGATLPPAAVRPMRGQLVELELPAPLLSHVVYFGGGYLVPRADGRVVVGATVEDVGYRKEVTADGLAFLLDLARRASPALGAARVGRSWSGLRPVTADHLPLLGPTSIAGLTLATGHFRNGILLSAVTADAIAAVALGEPPPFSLAPFSVERLGAPARGS